jgi:hypothetical protein
MPDFVKDAFDQAFLARCEAEEKAFNEVMNQRCQGMMLTAMRMAGIPELSRIFEFCQKEGLDATMHKYEMHLMAIAFHEGMNAPRMEDVK